MDVREQPIEPGQIPTTQNRIPITTLELVLKPGEEYFHCIADNIIYKDPLYETPLAELSRLQKDLKLERVSEVIPFLKSEGHIIRSGLCGGCEQEMINYGIAQA